MKPGNNRIIYLVVAGALAILLALSLLGAQSSGIFQTTVTLTSTITVSQTSFIKGYGVVFQQISCAPGGTPLYVQDWSVTLGNQTVIKPANGTVPDDSGFYESPDSNASAIFFFVPNGVYNYQVHPTYGFPDQNTSGKIAVNGSNVSFYLVPNCVVTGG